MTSRDTWKPPIEWRSLLPNEHELIAALTSQDFPAAPRLRQQLEHARAQQGCGCGCGTISLNIDPALAEPAVVPRQPTPGETNVVDDNGTVTGGLILFARNGYLSCLEIYSHLDEPQPLPETKNIRPFVSSTR